MMVDSRLEFANAADGSQSAGTFLAPNQVDLSVARDIGNGQPLYLVIQADEAFGRRFGNHEAAVSCLRQPLGHFQILGQTGDLPACRVDPGEQASYFR